MHGPDDHRSPRRGAAGPLPQPAARAWQGLAGPVEGNVDLPLHIVWSGRTSYSLDRPKSRMTLYRTVLAEGLSEDLVALLHHRLLTEQWSVLRSLVSSYICEVWEDAFPELLGTGSADTAAA
ncbi:hypothetical protein ACIQUX_01065 [Streptomyces sp. NPDC101133]|uniref:hypothetical protein n=1 Tax=Streptomyces sp. NPDC101133 TaxID=3366111 RepID=UPI00380D3D2A